MINEINTNIDKGLAILKEAVEKYNSGDLSKAYKYYKKAGKYLSEADSHAKTTDGAISLKYGGNRNFGIVYKIFEGNTSNLLKTKQGVSNLKKIMSVIKENKVLMDQFNVYNAFTNPINVGNVEEYVNEAVSLISRHSVNEVKSANNKLIRMFKKMNLNEDVKITNDEENLFEGIEYMILHNKNFSNMNEYAKIQKNLCEYVEDNKRVITESIDIDSIYDEKLNEFVNEQEKVLTEDEKKLIKIVTENPVKAKTMFNEHKSNVIGMLEEQIKSGSDVEEWQSILEKVKNKVYESNTALTTIAEFIDIENEING